MYFFQRTGWSGRNECCFGGDFEEGVEGQQFRLNGVRSSFVSKYRGYLGSSMDKASQITPMRYWHSAIVFLIV
eukprot:g3793.t1 g3793   contig13:170584-170872(-)